MLAQMGHNRPVI